MTKWRKEKISGDWRIYRDWSIRESNEVCRGLTEEDANLILSALSERDALRAELKVTTSEVALTVFEEREAALLAEVAALRAALAKAGILQERVG